MSKKSKSAKDKKDHVHLKGTFTGVLVHDKPKTYSPAQKAVQASFAAKAKAAAKTKSKTKKPAKAPASSTKKAATKPAKKPAAKAPAKKPAPKKPAKRTAARKAPPPAKKAASSSRKPAARKAAPAPARRSAPRAQTRQEKRRTTKNKTQKGGTSYEQMLRSRTLMHGPASPQAHARMLGITERAMHGRHRLVRSAGGMQLIGEKGVKLPGSLRHGKMFAPSLPSPYARPKLPGRHGGLPTYEGLARGLAKSSGGTFMPGDLEHVRLHGSGGLGAPGTSRTGGFMGPANGPSRFVPYEGKAGGHVSSKVGTAKGRNELRRQALAAVKSRNAARREKKGAHAAAHEAHKAKAMVEVGKSLAAGKVPAVMPEGIPMPSFGTFKAS